MPEVNYKDLNLSVDQQKNKKKLLKQKDQLEKNIAENKKQIAAFNPNVFKTLTVDDKYMKGFEYLKAKNPDIYKKVSDCVEVKNNKSTIKVEKLEVK